MRWCLRRVMDALAVPGERRLAHEPDLVLLLTLLGLVTFGMVMVFSASVGSDPGYAVRHAIWLALGAARGARHGGTGLPDLAAARCPRSPRRARAHDARAPAWFR